MHLDRRIVNAGAFLVALGGVPLLVQVGALDSARVADAWRLWPVLLIAAGIGFILARTRLSGLGAFISAFTLGVIGGGLLAAGAPGIGVIGCGGPGGIPFSGSSGAFSGSTASVSITVNCGDLRLTTEPGSGWTLRGSSTNGDVPTVDSGGSSLSITGRPVADFLDLGGRRSSWNVTLPTGPTLGVGLILNAGSGHLDLAGANLSSLSVTGNAGSTRIDGSRAMGLGSLDATVNAGELRIAVPAATVQGSVTVNAGSVGICVPPGTALRVQTSGALGSNDLGGHGLIESNGAWTTPGFDTAAVKIDIDATINAGTLKLDPSGGCS